MRTTVAEATEKVSDKEKVIFNDPYANRHANIGVFVV